ncbi:MAG: preprotein translocase subunit YajC [Planctomycetota bacterium]|nr:preprotein translocase subunit YajC [Planctomycetota bacterium]MCB9825891.1 preprotein translocase subunit YajC [Planctomycetota bacterium]MCB9901290.1 preprotein translocase subunit YajC [Planctomycetota bacterium]
MPDVLAALALPVLAADEAPAGSPLGSMLFPILIVFLIFYFLVLRPGSRDRKAREEKLKNLQKGAKVVTNAGIHGTVVGVDEDTVTLKVDDKTNTRIRFSKAAVWQVVDGSSGGDTASDSAS